MTNSEAIAILNIFDYWNERKPNYYGIPEVKFIYHGEWSDPELYYKGEYPPFKNQFLCGYSFKGFCC